MVINFIKIKNKNICNIKFFIFIIVIFFGFFSIISSASAADYYISPTGAASWQNCGGAPAKNGTEACSWQTAMANAVAGDTAYFRGGTYEVGTDAGDGYTGALNPSNSGMPSNPIIFMAYPGEVPILNGDWNNNSYQNVRVIANGNDPSKGWITYDGFTIQANGGTRGASILIGSSATPSGGGFVIKNLTVIGGANAETSYNDNFDGIRINGVTSATISNNKVYGFRRSDWGGSDDNFGCIKLYGQGNVVIENNELYNCNAGISIKRPSSNVIIRNNYIHDVQEGLHFNINTGVAYGSNNWSVYNNVINITAIGGSGGGAITGPADTGLYTNSNFEFYNNTIRNINDNAAYLGLVTNLKWYNNISIGLARSDYGFWNTVRNISTIAEEDHNQWGTNSFKMQVRRYGTFINYLSLSAWQASVELIGVGNPGVGDLISDPLFQNSSGTFTQLNDFFLVSNSPSKGTGRNGVDMGADISFVGVQSIVITDTIPPSAPIGLNIN